MRQQSYLLRKGAKYHFRRRMRHAPGKRPINLALGTADPVEARRLARRLAARWDEIEMYVDRRIQRGTLTLGEQEALFRRGLEDELARATAHRTAPIGDTGSYPAHHKVMAAALRIVARVPHDAQSIGSEVLEAEVDDSWTADELRLLGRTLRLMVTPMTVSRSDAKDALGELNIPESEGTLVEARSQILRGMAEAHRRAELLEHPVIASTGRGVMALLDDALVAAAADERPPVTAPQVPVPGHMDQLGHELYEMRANLRFSDVIEDVLEAAEHQRKWGPDNGQRQSIAETFAWITGDKPLSDYRSSDIDHYVAMLRKVGTDFRWGVLHKEGPMAVPFDPKALPPVKPDKRRSDRTINRNLSVLAAMSERLSRTHWKLRYGRGVEMNFLAYSIKVEEDPADPKRVPWTPEHLKAMYALPLWQGGGGSGARLKSAEAPAIYQDAAYWVPLIGTYTGLAREEACGLEVMDFNFDCEVPYLLVQANMTRSKDGKKPGGLKRKSRYRVMPLHPELLRLGLREYVQAAAQEQGDAPEAPIFPELYSAEAKQPSEGGDKAPQFGGRRFYSIAWCYIMDATHGVMPLPETKGGKKADFHSHRTYNQSVLASAKVSQTIIDRHMGHTPQGTGPRSYNRRGLALGEAKELRERLAVLEAEMPVVTEHVLRAPSVNLLHLRHRSRVGSAPGRSAKHKFCA